LNVVDRKIYEEWFQGLTFLRKWTTGLAFDARGEREEIRNLCTPGALANGLGKGELKIP
jgi:hypothetical protein